MAAPAYAGTYGFAVANSNNHNPGATRVASADLVIFYYCNNPSQTISNLTTNGGAIDLTPYQVDSASATGIYGAMWRVPASALTVLTPGNAISVNINTGATAPSSLAFFQVTGAVSLYASDVITGINGFSDTLTFPAGAIVVQMSGWAAASGVDPAPSGLGQTAPLNNSIAGFFQTGAYEAFTAAQTSQAITCNGTGVQVHGYVVLLGSPEIISLSPADNATGVSPTAPLVVTLDKPVTIGAGNWTVNETGGSTHDTVAAASVSQSTTTWANDTVTIPHTTLGNSLPYNIQAASGVLVGWAGIGNTTVWNWTTDSGAPAEPVEVAQHQLLGAPFAAQPAGLGQTQLLGASFAAQPIGLTMGAQELGSPFGAQPTGLRQRQVLGRPRIIFPGDGGGTGGKLRPGLGGVGIRRRM